jgi:hypothetical protein
MFSLLLIFVLYAAWDILGIWMARVCEDGQPKYPEITDDLRKTKTKQKPNWIGTLISVVWLLAFALLYLWVRGRTLDVRDAEVAFAIATFLLLSYRMAKEIRTSLKHADNDDGTPAPDSAPTA